MSALLESLITHSPLPAGMVRPQWLIEANTRAHTQDGYSSWHMVAAAHERTIRALCDELNVLRGVDLVPARGCHLAHDMTFGPLSVTVEYEAERGQREIVNADPDDCQEGFGPTVTVLRVYLNGRWCNAADVASIDQLAKWEESILEGDDE